MVSIFQPHLIKDGDLFHSLSKANLDTSGNRVQKTLVTSSNTNSIFYMIDDRNPSGLAQVVAECVTNSGSVYLTNSYLYGHGLIRETLNPNSSPVTYYFGYDGHRNVRFLIDSTGAITNTYSYDAFGIQVASSGSAPNKYLYCGEQFDSDLGHYCNRARYLNVTAGRFWTMDTFAGNPQIPPSLHKYLYCGDEPIGHTDPSGHFTLIEALVVGGITVAVTAVVAYETIPRVNVEQISFTKTNEGWKQGVWIELGANVKGIHRYKEYRWVQWVTTSHVNDPSRQQPNVPFIDQEVAARGEGDYYYTHEHEQQAHQLGLRHKPQYETIFTDKPDRANSQPQPGAPVTWKAECYLVGVKKAWDDKYTKLVKITYGFTMTKTPEGKVEVTEEKPVITKQ